MGSDAPESMGLSVRPGNNVYVTLDPDTELLLKGLQLLRDHVLDLGIGERALRMTEAQTPRHTARVLRNALAGV